LAESFTAGPCAHDSHFKLGHYPEAQDLEAKK
jgi:hypothetical protein